MAAGDTTATQGLDYLIPVERLYETNFQVHWVLLSPVDPRGRSIRWKRILGRASGSPQLRQRADDLIAQGRGGASLGAERLAILLTVEDPNFADHPGVDFSSSGAGATTITQSVSKRLAFKKFRPGFQKIRQTGYAIGLEEGLSKEQILALWLDTLEMGHGLGGWITGFHRASYDIYGRMPAELSNKEFIRLVAVLISPASYKLGESDTVLNERVRRIERLVAGACIPEGHSDVWLEGCQ